MALLPKDTELSRLTDWCPNLNDVEFSSYGKLKVCVLPEEFIVNPLVLLVTAKVWVALVNPFSEVMAGVALTIRALYIESCV
jgi:hypothetical protein